MLFLLFRQELIGGIADDFRSPGYCRTGGIAEYL
jgi:hypothetical protein